MALGVGPGGNLESIARFGADLKKFSRLVQVDYEKVVRRIALDILARIVRRTPVDTGRARASWNIQAGEPDMAVAPVGARPADRLSDTALLQARAMGRGRGIWITNALPYIVALEHGHSKQAPLGMVRITLAEVEAGILAEIADRSL